MHIALQDTSTRMQIPLRSTIYRVFAALPRKDQMEREADYKASVGVDKGLAAMFLKMSPEEHLQANDNAARTIEDSPPQAARNALAIAVQEFRDACKQQKNDRPGPKRST